MLRFISATYTFTKNINLGWEGILDFCIISSSSTKRLEMCAVLTYFDLVVLFCICGMCIGNKYTHHSLVGGLGQEEVNSHEYECAMQATTIWNVIPTNIGLKK
jgi:hypothetical protein